MSRNIIRTLVPGLVLAWSGLAAAANGLPWSSDFESGDRREWNGDSHGTVNIVQTPDAPSGNRAARVNLRSGTTNDNFLGHHFGDFATERGDKVEEIWLTLSSKFDEGYRFPSRESHKIAIFNLTDGRSWTRRYQVYLWVNSRGEYAIDTSNIATWDFNGLYQNKGTPAKVRFGEWDKLKMHVKLNRPGRSDGVIKLWVNGELKLEHNNVNIRGNDNYGINKLILSSYTSDSSGGSGTQWYDAWTLSEEDPDAGKAPPSAPVLRKVQ